MKATRTRTEEQFTADAPNRRWVGDTTEFVIGDSGKLYLAAILDLFSRFVVGWAVSAVNDRHLTLKALGMALRRRGPDAGLLHHSDQGCTYASEDYQRMLDASGIACSMSRRGNCYDNAVMESFFSSVKSETADRFASCGEAKMELFDYIEVFYNQRRRHSTLGQISPAEFERRKNQEGVFFNERRQVPYQFRTHLTNSPHQTQHRPRRSAGQHTRAGVTQVALIADRQIHRLSSQPPRTSMHSETKAARVVRKYGVPGHVRGRPTAGGRHAQDCGRHHRIVVLAGGAVAAQESSKAKKDAPKGHESMATGAGATDAATIAKAVSAAPPEIGKNATVMAVGPDGKMKQLRAGTNGWMCMVDPAVTRCASTRNGRCGPTPG